MASATKTRKTSSRKSGSSRRSSSRKSSSSSGPASSSASSTDRDLLNVLGADDASDESKQRLLKENKEQMAAGKVTGDEAKAAKAAQDLAQEDPVAARSQAGNRWQDNLAVRNAGEALQGYFVDVVDGDHEGRYGVYHDNATLDEKTGRPVTIIVETRDANAEYLTVNYDDVRRADAGGRR